MTAHYVPWSHDPRGEYAQRDHDATEASVRDASARVKDMAYAGQILDRRAYRQAVDAYREARARLYAIRETLPPNGLRREYEPMPFQCPDPEAVPH